MSSVTPNRVQSRLQLTGSETTLHQRHVEQDVWLKERGPVAFPQLQERQILSLNTTTTLICFKMFSWSPTKNKGTLKEKNDTEVA